MRLLIVDAFTDRPFAGNPAAVCLLDEPAEDAWMQRVAAEMNLSETAFARPVTAPDADYELRWFTPKVEVALCGHATLATAHALYDTGALPADRPVRFQTLKSGVLTVRHGAGRTLEMDFPAVPATEVPVPAELAGVLGVPVRWAGRNSKNELLVLVADAAAVRGLDPDPRDLAGIEARAIIVTARDLGGYDFVSRFFAPRAGIDEDPVTGSAHCVLAPFWADRLGRASLTGYQASERGGIVAVTLRDGRVTLTGSAVTVLTGDLQV